MSCLCPSCFYPVDETTTKTAEWKHEENLDLWTLMMCPIHPPGSCPMSVLPVLVMMQFLVVLAILLLATKNIPVNSVEKQFVQRESCVLPAHTCHLCCLLLSACSGLTWGVGIMSWDDFPGRSMVQV